MAVCANRGDVVQYLLENSTFATAEAIASVLLKLAGKFISNHIFKDLLQHLRKSNTTALFEFKLLRTCCMMDDESKVRLLVSTGTNVRNEEVTDESSCILNYVIFNDQNYLLKGLLELNFTNVEYEDAVLLADRIHNLDAIPPLLRKIGEETLLDMLTYSSYRSNFNLVRLLLDRGVNPVRQSKKYQLSPLLIAIRARNIPLVELMLEYGANLNAAEVDLAGEMISTYTYTQLFGHADVIDLLNTHMSQVSQQRPLNYCRLPTERSGPLCSLGSRWTPEGGGCEYSRPRIWRNCGGVVWPLCPCVRAMSRRDGQSDADDEDCELL